MKATAISVLLLCVALSAHAASDRRIQSALYDASSIVSISGREGFQSSILFGDDEKIENIAVGDSMSWQVTPNKRANLLFIKPVAPNATTNMTVVTDKRVYLFDLQPASRSSGLLYSLRFSYPPAPERPAPAPSPTTVIPPADTPSLASDGASPEWNYAWNSQGATALLPQRVFNDGRTVFLDWPAEAALPAILVAGSDGKEGPVNFRMRGNTIAIDTTARQLVLRRGAERATLTNLAPDKVVNNASLGQGVSP